MIQYFVRYFLFDILGLHHSFLDFQFYRYQEHHGFSMPFDNMAYAEGNHSKSVIADSLLLPWGIPIRNAWTVEDVCVSYKPQDYSIVAPSTPDDGSIKEPGNGKNWLDKAPNRTFADEVAKKTREDVVKENKKRSSGGIGLGVSIIGVAIVMLF